MAGKNIDGRHMTTKNDFRFLHTLQARGLGIGTACRRLELKKVEKFFIIYYYCRYKLL